MGIKHLNKYLIENCTNPDSIKSIYFHNLHGKTIIIDTSIYMYKFALEDKLIENMYLLISIFKIWKIRALFIFDGKPPPEKRALIKKRKWEKYDAEQKFNILKTEIESTNLSVKERNHVINQMDDLKRKFIRITHEQIANVKQLMDAYAVEYYDAPGEADLLCVYLVKTGYAWACMSDDMDMFLYGCDRVIRNINIITNECVLYDTQSIMLDLKMSPEMFNEIIVISGTDYNIQQNTTFIETIRWYKEYNKTENKKYIKCDFYNWLQKNTKYVSKIDEIDSILDLFNIEQYNVLFDSIIDIIRNNKPRSFNIDDIMNVISPHGFILHIPDGKRNA
jgi:5'-3' exonuclease